MKDSSTIGIPGAPTSISQIVLIANGSQATLDSTTAARIKKESPSPNAFKAEEPETFKAEQPETEGVAIRLEEMRAICVAILSALSNGRSGVRLQVAEKLLEFLAASPKNASSVSMGEPLQILYRGVLNDTAENALPLSTEERKLLTDNECPLLGTTALIIHSCELLQKLAVTIAALTCEAGKADVRRLDLEKLEAATSQQKDFAEQLQDLLQKSARVNARKEGLGVQSSILAVPTVQAETASALQLAEQQLKGLMTVPIADHSTARDQGLIKSLVKSLLSLAETLADQAALSRQRVEQVQRFLSSEQAKGKGAALLQSLQQECSSIVEDSQALLRRKTTTSQSSSPQEHFEVASQVYSVCRKALRVLLIEASTDLVILEGVSDNVEEAAPEESAKAKKKKGKADSNALGIGTARFLQLLRKLAATGEMSNLNVQQSNGSAGNDAERMMTAVSFFDESLSKEVDHIFDLCIASRPTKKPKVAKGARDFTPDQMTIREHIFQKIVTVFKRHGAVTIDTPDFELKETLTGKYGEDSKLIYDLKDQGGELLSLRYDLTVPFARYMATRNETHIQRFHIGKVHRRDQPQMARGRFREFYQCDLDFAGTCSLMTNDASVLKAATEILTSLELGKFTIKINHRRLLDGMMETCGVPASKFRTICSAIDKLDKEPWKTVKSEMVNEKGLDEKVADKIGVFVANKGVPQDILAKLQAEDHEFQKHEGCKAALSDMALLFKLLTKLNCIEHFSFDLSLARGLDYYTGVIYEVVLETGNVGSIAAGGRYDNLIGMFSNKQIPAVGISFGVERIFAILEQRHKEKASEVNGNIRETETQVLVMSASKGLAEERTGWAGRFWDEGVCAEPYNQKDNPFMQEQMSYAATKGIRFGVVLREDDLKNQGTVELMDFESGENQMLKLDDVVSTVKSSLQTAAPLSLVIPGRS